MPELHAAGGVKTTRSIYDSGRASRTEKPIGHGVS